MDWLKVLENSVYLLALLNPPSKILFLSTYEPELEMRQIWELSWKSSLAALLMLISFAIVGQFVLEQIFRISLYSLKITGGLVIFFIGWMAVREGKFFQKRENELRNDFTELSIVPLAAPSRDRRARHDHHRDLVLGAVRPPLVHHLAGAGDLRQLRADALFPPVQPALPETPPGRAADPDHRADRLGGGGSDDPRRSRRVARGRIG